MKLLKSITIFFLILVNSKNLISQDKIIVGINYGIYISSKSNFNLSNSENGRMKGISLETKISKKYSLACDFNVADYKFFKPNTIINNFLGNSDVTHNHFGFLLKRELFNIQSKSIKLGIGLGILTNIKSTPYEYFRPNGSTTIPDSFQLQSAWNDLEFPISLEYSRNFKKINFGMKVGTYIYPDYPIAGSYISVLAGYRL